MACRVCCTEGAGAVPQGALDQTAGTLLYHTEEPAAVGAVQPVCRGYWPAAWGHASAPGQSLPVQACRCEAHKGGLLLQHPRCALLRHHRAPSGY